MEGSAKRPIESDNVDELKKKIKRWEAFYELAEVQYFTQCETCHVPYPDELECEECECASASDENQ